MAAKLPRDPARAMKRAEELQADADRHRLHALRRALEIANGSQSDAARLLRIPRTNLRYLLETRYPTLLRVSEKLRRGRGDLRGRRPAQKNARK
jgi:hypothetical protein